ISSPPPWTNSTSNTATPRCTSPECSPPETPPPPASPSPRSPSNTDTNTCSPRASANTTPSNSSFAPCCYHRVGMQTSSKGHTVPEGSPYARHLPALDGVRGLAVLGVACSHIFPGTPHSAWQAVVHNVFAFGS